jgi:hypothetical protein
MSDKYPFIPDYLTKALEDTSIPLIDLMHGYLKQEMLVVEEEMKNNEVVVKDFDNTREQKVKQELLIHYLQGKI